MPRDLLACTKRYEFSRRNACAPFIDPYDAALCWIKLSVILDVAPYGLRGFCAFALVSLQQSRRHHRRFQINEIMAAAHYAVADEDGEYSDWIELHNTGNASVNLNGWHLTDDDSRIAKWTFPSVEIAPGGYLVIFASDKDRAQLNRELHTNFNLDQDGEYLALVRPDGTVEDKFAPYPAQIPDVSYDRQGNYLAQPTPGATNRTDALAIASAPILDQPRGFKSKPLLLTITSGTPEATIRYTLDGSTPSADHGEIYRRQISIKQTTVVRAIAIAGTLLPSPVVTRTFLFTGDIAKQSLNGKAPAGWPKRWGAEHAVDYGMDPDIVNSPGVRRTLANDLKSIPSLSLVMDLEDLFGAKRGIYANPLQKGDDWERPMSLEWIDPDGEAGFQSNGGVRIRGGASRMPDNPKHSFHFVFRREYGAANLEYPVFGPNGARHFDKFDLRCAQTNSWHFWVDPRTEFIRDQFFRDTQGAMGQPYTRGDYFHLYINGQYWGLYNTQEKPDASYGISYFGGNEDDYDWIKYDNDGGSTMASDGTFAAWSRLCEMGARGFFDNVSYQRVQGLNPDGSRNPAYERLLDIDNLIDYMIAGIYGGARDNPHAGGGQNNWSGIRSRKGDFGFQFLVHDFEFTFGEIEDDLLEDEPTDVTEFFETPYGVNPWHFWQALRRNREFRVRVADRIQRHFFGNGVLTPEACAERFKVRMREIDRAVVGESARWGDANPEHKNKPFRRADWLNVCNEYLLQSYFPVRTGIVLQQFREANLYPNVGAPLFSPPGASLAVGETVTISNPDSRGTIYFTVNGKDPREIGGAVSNSAQVYSTPIALNQKTSLKARIKDGDNWSALVEAQFAVNVDYSALRFTEIHYNPLSNGVVLGDDYEFIELQNAGSGAIDLSGMKFNEGITFAFPNNTTLAGGAYLVLVRDATRFAEAHPGVPIGGVYTGRLDNAGEKLTLVTSDGTPVLSINYGDSAPWPAAGDGLGFSIVLAKARKVDEGGSWRASAQIGGSPGGPDPASSAPSAVVVNEILPRPNTGSQRIELCNIGDEPVNISGWWLTNDLAQPKKFQIPAGTVVSPGAYVVFSGENFSSSPGAEGALIFSATGDSVWLVSADAAGVPTGYVDGFTFGAARAGISFGRWLNSDGAEQFPASSSATFGEANSEPLVSALRITELHYRTATGDVDWVELKNSSSVPAAVGGWKLDGLGFTFPSGAVIPAQGFTLVVAGDPSVFRAKHQIPASVTIYGPAPGTLQDNGEEVALRQPSDLDSAAFVTLERVRYNDKAPWPVWSPSEVNSLQRIVAVAYADDPQSWLAGAPSPGSDGELLAPPRVRLVEPVNGASFTGPAKIRLRADVQDPDGPVKRVEFRFDGETIGEVTTAPWEFEWTTGTGGLHDLTAVAFDSSGGITESEPVSVRIDEPDRGTGLGLKGEYFAGLDLEGTAVVRIDPQVDLKWSQELPIEGIPQGPISIRWTGKFMATRAGEYVFFVRANGGVRFWINNGLQVDMWDQEGFTEFPVPILLDAGTVHTLKLEYKNSDGNGEVALLLTRPGSPNLDVIPQDKLYTPDQDPTAVGITTPQELPNGARGTVYRTKLRAVSGEKPYIWSWEVLPGSTLPDGLTLRPNGDITGIPVNGGEFRFRAQVADAAGGSANRSFVLRIDDRLQELKPRLVLTQPTSGTKLKEGKVRLAGSVQIASSRSLAEVFFSVNEGPWRALTTATTWDITLTHAAGLQPGNNTVRVKARDNQGQESVVLERSFEHVVFRPLHVEVRGNGKITAGFEGTTQREVGRSYTIRATPAPGWSFYMWEGAGFTRGPVVSFRMAEGTNIAAVFRQDVFPTSAGSYTGLLSGFEKPLQAESRGVASITVSRSGAFTAMIRVGTESIPLKGRVDEMGSYFAPITTPAGKSYELSFWIDTFASPRTINFALNWFEGENFFDSGGALGRLVYHPRKKPFPGAGQYTVRLAHGDAPAPQGDGYGIIRIDKGGRATVTGELADGTPWSAAAPITSSGTAPIFVPLYTEQGLLTGDLALPSDTDPSWAWLKSKRPEDTRYPEGISAALSAHIARYSAPPSGTRAVELTDVMLELSEGNLSSRLFATGTLSDESVFGFTLSQLEQLDLRIDPATGEVSGTFAHPESGLPTLLRGVVDQQAKTIHGYFFGTDTSGSLSVTAPR